jgi:hypothetical protein
MASDSATEAFRGLRLLVFAPFLGAEHFRAGHFGIFVGRVGREQLLARGAGGNFQVLAAETNQARSPAAEQAGSPGAAGRQTGGARLSTKPW